MMWPNEHSRHAVYVPDADYFDRAWPYRDYEQGGMRAVEHPPAHYGALHGASLEEARAYRLRETLRHIRREQEGA